MDTAEPVGGVVAQRLRMQRLRQRLTTRDVEQRLREIGYSLSFSSVAKSEAEDPARRRAVSVEELMALAFVLRTSPMRLLLPWSDVAVTPGRSMDASTFVGWVFSDLPPAFDGVPEWAARPRHRHVPATSGGWSHPATAAAERLMEVIGDVFARSVMRKMAQISSDPTPEGPSVQELVDRLRQALALANRHVELLIDELKWDAYPDEVS